MNHEHKLLFDRVTAGLLDKKSDKVFEQVPLIIAFVGAGGKTTAMYWLAKELVQQYGKRVLVTTTTNIWKPETEHQICQNIVVDDFHKLFQENKAKIPECIVFGEEKRLDNGKIKLTSPGLSFFSWLKDQNLFDVVLVEADGSAKRSIKAPAEYEPVVPEFTDLVIGVVGLSVLGKPVNETHVHRLAHFMHVTGLKKNELIQIEHLVALAQSSKGLFKSTEKAVSRTLLLTQVRGHERTKALREIKAHLNGIAKSGKGVEIPIVGADLINGVFY